jgi:hypothetical protein
MVGWSLMQSSTDSVSRLSSVAAGARLVSINVGRPRTLAWHGRSITSAIWKEPVTGPVAIRGSNLAGDDQADRQATADLTRPCTPTH